MSDIFVMPNLSDITTEIDIDSIGTACSTWNSSIASIDINPSGLKAAFQPLNNNGIATNSIDSIANALNQISSITISIGNYLRNNLESQTAADDTILNKASESSNLSDLIPIDQYSLGGTKASSSSFDSSGYGTSTSADNKSQDLNINKDSALVVGTLSGNEFRDNNQSLENISNSGGGDTVNADMNKYSDITNQNLENVSNNKELNEIQSNEVGEEVVNKNLESIGNNNFVSDETKEIIYKYIKNKVILAGMDYNDAQAYYSTLSSISNDIDNILDSNIELIDLYDGNGCSDINKDSISFIRGMVDGLAENKNITAEALLTDSNYHDYLTNGMKEISLALADYQYYL